MSFLGLWLANCKTCPTSHEGFEVWFHSKWQNHSMFYVLSRTGVSIPYTHLIVKGLQLLTRKIEVSSLDHHLIIRSSSLDHHMISRWCSDDSYIIYVSFHKDVKSNRDGMVSIPRELPSSLYNYVCIGGSLHTRKSNHTKMVWFRTLVSFRALFTIRCV